MHTIIAANVVIFLFFFIYKRKVTGNTADIIYLARIKIVVYLSFLYVKKSLCRT
jgi:hypothetical protein